ncbi:uncharacterized protein KIAA1522 homolog isoform X3 [Phycodurus eques]|nr:uncharacterized protein KIAA1522 homolog isoform X3 [Phycodurus eques]XP_061552425.1 uncharacterized protein KIAA1522 homolog isoform X3 [Phycodurus eques]
MSNRDSLGFGDLIPHDVVEIFAQEKHHKKGRKKRSHSLGRALGWLKGKKRKDLGANGQNPGLGPALDLALDGHAAAHLSGNKGGHKSGRQTQTQGNSHGGCLCFTKLKSLEVSEQRGKAVLNLHDDKTPPPPLLQENVFIEASRPKYLEDLHSEALEGLKMMQQEDNNVGVEFQDNESTTSTMTAQTDGEGEGFTTDSTIPDTSSVASMQSSVSRRSSRSGLTRQGSTFRPLNSGKQSEKGRTRRRHRKTVGGIPRHVQRELGMELSLYRVGRTVSSKLEEEEHFSGRSDSAHQGESQPGENVIQPMEQIRAGHMDDLALLHRLCPDLTDGQRPRSLAVPSMTTANSLQQEMPSPVISMSPQAAYMSKIIPNAVLPPSIEVVEISRGQSRNSVRTVSKSSLLLSSPSPSRSSCRTTSSRGSKVSSACNHNPYNLSDTSGWSHSESSETLVSDSSTISSGNISRKEASQDSIKITVNGKLISKERGAKREGPFVRSLSVMKPKRAPPPPSRSYSLHKMKRRSRDLAEVVVISKESSPQSGSALGGGTDEPEASPVRTIDSPGYNGDMSSLDDSTGSVLFRMAKSPQASDLAKAGKTVSSTQEKWKPPQENKVSKITSPSSGYSSQDCMSPQLELCSSSPKRKRGILAKLQRLFPGASSPSSLTHLETNENTISVKSQPIKVDCESVSHSVRTLRKLFDIPPHPKVHAPPAPPPEVWAHNKRTFELLLGPPAPDNVYAIIKKNPKDRRQQRSSASVSTEGSVKTLAGERKQKNLTTKVESTNGMALGTQKVQESARLNVNEVYKISNERLSQNVNSEGNGKVKQNDEKVRVSDILNGMLVKAVEKREERLAGMRDSMGKSTATQASEVTAKMDIIHTLSLTRTSPSPPPAHFPPEPPGKQTTQVNNLASPDSSWPPPPPPIIQMVSVPDELDFPLPPPPLISEEGLVAALPTSPPNSVPAAVNITDRHSYSTRPTIIVTAEPEPQESVTSHEVGPPPPLSIPAPPAYAAPPPPVIVNIPMRMKEVIASPLKEVPPPITEKVSPRPPEVVPAVLAKESATPVVQVLPSLIPKDIPRPLVNFKEDPPPQVSQPALVPPETVSALCSEEVIPPSSQESNSQTPEEETLASKLYPPQSIPPPPPPPSESLRLDSEVILQQESISSESQRKQISCNGILTPPQNIPPPPPLELLPSTEIAPPNTGGFHIQQVPVSPPSDVSIPSNFDIRPSSQSSPPLSIPVPPLLPTGGLASLLHQTSTASTENESPEPSSENVQEEPVVTLSLLQMVKLQPVNSSPEPPIAQGQAQSEAVLTIQQPNNLVQSHQPNNEAPQKPIRRSLIISSPTSTSPPAIVTSQPALPQDQTVVVVVPPAPSPAALRSPAMITSPATSMNLQEAIRLRTAARSKHSSALRLSLHSPTSPKDHGQSPTNTASFIFSKNNKRVGVDTKKPSQKNQDISTKVIKEVEIKKVKMPPPVAKKPKTKAIDVKSSDGMEQTAGQPAQTESIMDAAEKSNGAETGDAGGGAT